MENGSRPGIDSTLAKWALVATGLFAAAGGVVAYHARSIRAERRQVATSIAVAAQQSIEGFISAVDAGAYELAEAARAHPDEVDLDGVAPAILARYGDRVAYLHLQPGGVASKVYPLVGNEALLGLDVLRDPLRGPRAEVAIRTRLPTLDGPHPLRQGGGDGLVVRVPLFRRSSAGGIEQFWGFAGATATLGSLLSASHLDQLERDGYAWSLVRADGRRVAGSSTPLLHAPVVVEATLPNESWTFSIAPRDGWGARRADQIGYGALLAITAMTAAFAYRVLRLPETLRRAVRQQTLALARAYREREAILAGIPDPAWMKDREGRWVAVNAALGKLAGLPPAEMIGKHHRDVFPQGAHEVERHDREVLERGEPLAVEESVPGPDGSLLWFEVVKHPYCDEAGAMTGQIGIARDVTARRRAENALRESEERFRQLVENTTQLFWIADVHGSAFLYVSPACERVWGTPPGESRNDAALRARVHADDVDRFAAAFDDAPRGADVEYRISWLDGSVHWIRERTFPIRDDAGRVYRVAGIAEDVSQRRAMEATLLHSQKLKAVGQLAGGIAHDFNNLLCVITASADLIREDVDPTSPMAADVQEIRDAAARAKRLTQQLLAFGHRQVLQPRVLRLADVVAETATMLGRLIGENIELRVAAEEGLWCVRADRGQMEQVIVNLVVNARDAMPKGGQLTITTRSVVVDAALAERHDGASTGPHVVLEVVDTGSGIDGDTRARMFDPYFTTKPSGKGTGLGLSMVYGAVKQSGGFIEVDTELGRGAGFFIYLPRSEEAVELPIDRVPATSARNSVERILLVEDEDAVRAVAARSLRCLGYTVQEAANAATALEMVRGGVAADLLLTDIVMPGLSGRDLVERLRAEGFELPVLYMSGHTSDAAKLSDLPPGTEFIAKPFSLDDLAVKIRAAIGSTVQRPRRARQAES